MKIIGIFALILGFASACLTPHPVEPASDSPLASETAGMAETPSAQGPLEPQPAPKQHGFLCLPVYDQGPDNVSDALGFRITQIEVIEKDSYAELILKRESNVGGIPLKTLHFDSTRYHKDKNYPYGEWEGSEHWMRLQRTRDGYEGHFVFESEFPFNLNCS